MLLTKVKGIGQFALWVAATAALVLLSLVDITPLFGMPQKAISVGSLLMPLTGCVSAWLAFVIAAARGVLGYANTQTWLSFALYVPGLCAALAWRFNSRLLHVGIPAVCIVSFIAHPQGSQAALYSAYWLIPITLSLFARFTLFTRALSSTFIAHAVGSVIWLYAYTIPVSVWHQLIPVVFFERLLFALTLVSVYNTAHVVIQAVKTHVTIKRVQAWKKRLII